MTHNKSRTRQKARTVSVKRSASPLRRKSSALGAERKSAQLSASDKENTSRGSNNSPQQTSTAKRVTFSSLPPKQYPVTLRRSASPVRKQSLSNSTKQTPEPSGSSLPKTQAKVVQTRSAISRQSGVRGSHELFGLGATNALQRANSSVAQRSSAPRKRSVKRAQPAPPKTLKLKKRAAKTRKARQKCSSKRTKTRAATKKRTPKHRPSKRKKSVKKPKSSKTKQSKKTTASKRKRISSSSSTNEGFIQTPQVAFTQQYGSTRSKQSQSSRSTQMEDKGRAVHPSSSDDRHPISATERWYLFIRDGGGFEQRMKNLQNRILDSVQLDTAKERLQYYRSTAPKISPSSTTSTRPASKKNRKSSKRKPAKRKYKKRGKLSEATKKRRAQKKRRGRSPVRKPKKRTKSR